jgi:hypothetical protein
MGKFDAKFNEGIFLGYSSIIKAYKIYNRKTLIVEESMYVIFNEPNPFDPKREKDVGVEK